MNKEIAKTRSQVKQVILESLTGCFVKGFDRWHKERQEKGATSLFADALEKYPISLRRGTPEIKRRFYYFFKVYKAFYRFLVELEETEKIILEPDVFDEYRVPMTFKDREEAEAEFAKAYGEEERRMAS